MVIIMKDLKLTEIKAVRRFLENAGEIEMEKVDKEEAYDWIEKVLKRFNYAELRKKDKGVIRGYIKKVSGYSSSQITRLIKKYKETDSIKQENYERNRFEKKYTKRDIRLLAKTAELHNYPNGAKTKRNLQREFNKYGKEEYKNISEISVSHIYNLRKTTTFKRTVSYYKGTKKSKEAGIGKRTKPEPQGQPGYIRIDTVEQGDTQAGGGMYHINTVDEITQWQVIGGVKTITHKELVPLLENIIEQYPFKIINFHSDNGSEYINKYVAKLLNELLIGLTKSRPRQSTDNALAETKNNVVRKCIGYGHIPKKYAQEVNDFYFEYFNEYLNYHYPCAFAEEKISSKGKIEKIYPEDNYMTPFEKLKSINNAEKYLKEGMRFGKLDEKEREHTDNEMADIVQEKKNVLFDKIFFAA